MWRVEKRGIIRHNLYTSHPIYTRYIGPAYFNFTLISLILVCSSPYIYSLYRSRFLKFGPYSTLSFFIFLQWDVYPPKKLHPIFYSNPIKIVALFSVKGREKGHNTSKFIHLSPYIYSLYRSRLFKFWPYFVHFAMVVTLYILVI